MKEIISSDSSNLNFEIKEYKNKYRLVAEEIYLILGAGNYQNVYNCMTRFRAQITNKNLVDVEKIKKLKLIKGVHWNGNELQIIIGGEVVKVVDEFKKYEEELLKPQPKNDGSDLIKIKKSVGSRILTAMAGIMGPTIPILMAAGICGAIYALLTLPNGNNVLTTSIIVDGKKVGIDLTNLFLFDIWSSIFFVLNKVLLNAIGLFFIYNTTKYFKGNTIFALAIGITLMSRAFFPAGMGVSFDNASFGDWTANLGKSGFLLFKLGSYPIVLGGYEGNVIPYIVGAFVVVYLDKWIKTWMPSVIDIVFRPTLVYIVSILSLWFVLGPVAGLIEYGLISAFNWFGNIPYGIGTGLFALFWQPLVLTGCHVAVVLPMISDMAQGNASVLYGSIGLGVWGQVGAVIGVAIVTRNITLKKIAVGGVTAGIFGITEPIIYGVNLPKVKPFLLGCVGGLIAGIVYGNTGQVVERSTGLGIFGLLGFPPEKIWIQALICLLSVVSAAVLAGVFYTERKNELSYFKKAIHKFSKITKTDKAIAHQKFEPYLNQLKNQKHNYKKMTNYYSQISKYEQEMVTLENKESKHREKMYQQLMKLKAKLIHKKNQELVVKFNKLNDEYSNFSLEKQKNEVQMKLDKVMINNKQLVDNFTQFKEKNYQEICNLKHYLAKQNHENLEAVENMFWNALNSVEIGFGIEDAKVLTFRKETKNEKNKHSK